MAGAGYKLFATGDVLTAAQVNTYLNEQTVMVFADSAARTTALSGVLAEGMMSYLQDTDSVEVYDGTSWTAVGGGSSPLTTKGDLYTFSTVDARLGVGANGTVLTADSAETTGLKWASPTATAPNYTLINTGGTTLSGAGTVTVSGISGKNDLYIFIAGVTGGDVNNYANLFFRINTDTGSNYEYVAGSLVSTDTSGGSLSVANLQSASATSISLGGHKTPATFGITIQGANAAGFKPIQYVGSGLIANDYNNRVSGQGAYRGTGTISSVSIISTSGDLDSGTIYVYGA